MSIVAYLGKGFAFVLGDIFSLITIACCAFIKIPQIQTIIERKSAEGISVLGLCLELYCYSVMMAYNYASSYDFLSYMEYPILLLQEFVLTYIVFKYNNLLNMNTLIAAVLYGVLALIIYLKLMPLVVLSLMVPFCTPIGATSKLLQLAAILQSKDSSSVSLTTWGLSAFTNFTRIYTVYIESGDPILLTNFTISMGLSSAVFAAAYIYKKPKCD